MKHILSNYLKVVARNILKHKTFSLINVVDLAAAMSVGMLIIILIADILLAPIRHRMPFFPTFP